MDILNRVFQKSAFVFLGFMLVVVGVGCVPLPLITPPLKTTVGGGAGFGSTPEDSTTREQGTGIFALSVGAHPVQLFLQEPTWDAGVGFVFESFPGTDQDPLLGGYVEGGYSLWHDGDRETGQGRLFLVGQLEVLHDNASGFSGIGASGGFAFEFAILTAESVASVNNDSAYFGVHVGEWAIGAELTFNIRQVGFVNYQAVLLQLVVRSPLTFGVLLVPVFNP